MEGIVFDVSALRRDYRDSITQLSNTAVHRKNVDDDIVAESCYICLRGWEIGEEVTTLRCECSSYAHEACLAKSVFETGDCPTCRKSIFLIDDEIILGQAAADGDTEKLRRLLENGIQRSPRGLFDSTPLLQAAQNGQRETIRLLLEHGASRAPWSVWPSVSRYLGRDVFRWADEVDCPMPDTPADNALDATVHDAWHLLCLEADCVLSFALPYYDQGQKCWFPSMIMSVEAARTTLRCRIAWMHFVTRMAGLMDAGSVGLMVARPWQKGVPKARSISILWAVEMYSEGLPVRFLAAEPNPGRFHTLWPGNALPGSFTFQ
ncbi:hypothetical protein BGZ60DRAFT_432824 [Tricladium varicosporioides]|nr:hypothetical protein BGZ60DRAFT_432824 [Hymenoscyphus varicosporioides]